jgi:hypothetical protein
MHSGGDQKLDWGHIYIEAPEEEAMVIFYNRFGRNPHRVTCTCCGEDYSVTEYPTLEIATAFERGLRVLDTPRDKDGKYLNEYKFPTQNGSCYLEPGEALPEGFKKHRDGFLLSMGGFEKDKNPEGMTLEELANHDYYLIVRAEDIKDEERKGSVPSQGYVWMGDD